MALQHPDPETIQMAAWVLGERREMAAVSALLDLLERSKEAGALEASVEAVGKIGASDAVPVLESHVAQWPLRVRLRVVESLRCIGGREAGVVLRALAEGDPSGRVQEAARNALATLFRQDASEG